MVGRIRFENRTEGAVEILTLVDQERWFYEKIKAGRTLVEKVWNLIIDCDAYPYEKHEWKIYALLEGSKFVEDLGDPRLLRTYSEIFFDMTSRRRLAISGIKRRDQGCRPASFSRLIKCMCMQPRNNHYDHDADEDRKKVLMITSNSIPNDQFYDRYQYYMTDSEECSDTDRDDDDTDDLHTLCCTG